MSAVRSQIAPLAHLLDKEVCSEVPILPRGGELPGGCVLKGWQPSGERIISGSKQKDGPAMTGAGMREQGMERAVEFLARVFQLWILLEDPRLSQHVLRSAPMAQLISLHL